MAAPKDPRTDREKYLGLGYLPGRLIVEEARVIDDLAGWYLAEIEGLARITPEGCFEVAEFDDRGNLTTRETYPARRVVKFVGRLP